MQFDRARSAVSKHSKERLEPDVIHAHRLPFVVKDRTESAALLLLIVQVLRDRSCACNIELCGRFFWGSRQICEEAYRRRPGAICGVCNAQSLRNIKSRHRQRLESTLIRADIAEDTMADKSWNFVVGAVLWLWGRRGCTLREAPRRYVAKGLWWRGNLREVGGDHVLTYILNQWLAF
jgi:hypothetical protein